MVAAAAREIRDGDKVFVGMRLPLLGFAVSEAQAEKRATPHLACKNPAHILQGETEDDGDPKHII